MRQMQTSAALSRAQLTVPGTARERRRRNNNRLRAPLAALRKLVLTARWVSLLILTMCVYTLVLIGTDEHFYLTLIPVEGVASFPAQDIVQASGLAGVHIFAADPSQAASQIAELPGVTNASVALRWPNHVEIEIQEDTPVAVWQEGEEAYWITDRGRLIPWRAGAPGLLTIEYELPSAEIASRPDEAVVTTSPQPNLAFVPQDVLSGALMLRSLRPNIAKLFYRPSGGLSFQDGRGFRVYFGTGTDMHQKLAVYEAILEELESRSLAPTYISVSNQEKPFYLAR
jgi:hypothetical protein